MRLFSNIMITLSTMNTYKANFEMMKHQGKNIPMGIVQKTRDKQNFCNSQLHAQNINR